MITIEQILKCKSKRELGHLVSNYHTPWPFGYLDLNGSDCYFSENCPGCSNCRYSNNCIDCQNCTTCWYCKNCSRCFSCSSCKSCWGCQQCFECINCAHCFKCMFSHHLAQNSRYVVCNVQLTEDQYLKLRNNIITGDYI